jgi:hypothetical protein
MPDKYQIMGEKHVEEQSKEYPIRQTECRTSTEQVIMNIEVNVRVFVPLWQQTEWRLKDIFQHISKSAI